MNSSRVNNTRVKTMQNKIDVCHAEAEIRLGRISYLNVAPVYYGLDNGLSPQWLDTVCGSPSELNRQMIRGQLDISPVSSEAYARNQDRWLLLPDLSISCRGKVKSVLLVSKTRLEDLDGRKLIVTEESATAAALIRLILTRSRICPCISAGKIGRPCDLPSRADAAVVIGDKALGGRWPDYFPHIYDLGETWHGITGRPFVFAVWAVQRHVAAKNPHLVSAVRDLLYKSRAEGERNRARIVVAAADRLGLGLKKARDYYRGLNYHLGEGELKGLDAFFKGLTKAGLIPAARPTAFFSDPPAVLPRRLSRQHAFAPGLAGGVYSYP